MKTKIHPLKINFEIPVSNELKLNRFVNLFIIEGKKLHLIDSGVASAFSEIEKQASLCGKNISDIKNIFLTHSHPDHIGAAKLIQNKTDCQIFAPKKEAELISDTNLQFRRRPIPGFHKLVAGPVKINYLVENGKDFQLEENITILTIATPGHSIGSTSYFLKAERVLFCGDAVLLPGEIPIFENVSQYLRSLDKIRELTPEILYSSWDKPRYSDEIPEILEKSKSYVLQIQKTVKEVAKESEYPNSIGFCKKVLQNLGQNTEMANPLLLNSFLACLND